MDSEMHSRPGDLRHLLHFKLAEVHCVRGSLRLRPPLKPHAIVRCSRNQ
jgi:hypothetical protein